MTPDAVTCITNALEPPRFTSDVEPNDAPPMKSPVTKAPPTPSCAMLEPWVEPHPPAWTAQSTAPNAVTCMTNTSESYWLWLLSLDPATG